MCNFPIIHCVTVYTVHFHRVHHFITLTIDRMSWGYLLILVLGSHLHTTFSEQMLYPWAKVHDSNFHFEERQNELLTALRSELRLDFISDNLPVGMDKDHSMYIHNSEGHKYTCGIKKEEALSVVDTTKSEEKSLTSYQKAFRVIDGLQKVCMIHSIDWWSYEWCHRKEVKQFHVDVHPQTNKRFRNPEWSLGTYVYSDYYSAELDEDTVEEVIDYYEDGQICEETGEGRKVEVHLRCCSEDPMVHSYREARDIPGAKVRGVL